MLMPGCRQSWSPQWQTCRRLKRIISNASAMQQPLGNKEPVQPMSGYGDRGSSNTLYFMTVGPDVLVRLHQPS